MPGWLQASLLAAIPGAVLIFLILIIRRCFCPRKRRDIAVDPNLERAENPQNGIPKLHQVSIHRLDRDGSNKRTNHYVLRHAFSSRSPLFNWDDHPSLITDAVENGWSRFAFTTTYTYSSSVRSAKFLLSSCSVGDHDREMGVEISWEVSQGSADFMQKIGFNSKAKKNASISAMAAKSVVRTALPFPGPPLKTLAFPQEAYFEVTIWPFIEDGIAKDSVGKVKGGKLESEKAKLIQEDFKSTLNSESLVHVTSVNQSNSTDVVNEFKGGGKQVGKAENVVLSVGLAGGGPLPLKLPGSYPSSVGFNSNGSVYLDGIKLVSESEKEDWGKEEIVIGCGYNPGQKKVFFTMNSQLLHEIHCQSEEFGSPLYPVLAANGDTTVLINLGQCSFKYAPANLHRTPNPCFIGPLANNSPVLGYEDSKELFSMGRIDSHWLNRSIAARSNNTTGTLHRTGEFDEESEGDLFEIVLDNMDKSPYVNKL